MWAIENFDPGGAGEEHSLTGNYFLMSRRNEPKKFAELPHEGGGRQGGRVLGGAGRVRTRPAILAWARGRCGIFSDFAAVHFGHFT